MSGPITAGFVLTQGLLALSARAIAEAQALKQEYADVLERLQQRERELADARRAHQAARIERLTASHRELVLRHAQVERMRALADTLGLASEASLPAMPTVTDEASMSAHRQILDAAAQALRATLAASEHARGAEMRQLLDRSAHAPTLDEVLSAYALQRRLVPGLDATETARLQTMVERVLARLDASDEPLPAELDALARAIVLAPSIDRAEALASELRRAVQRTREARAAAARDAALARQWLDALPEDAPAALVQAVERVASGTQSLDASLRSDIEAFLAALATARAQAEQQAAALVLEQSLRDLGYEVEDIDATLFVDGGTVHFRRAGWESYSVRLRVAAAEQTVNFNVVRARGEEENAERRRLDALAEDRWCAEFPALMRTLAARGLELRVTRRLAAGELPVQVVDPASLQAAGTQAAERTRAPSLKQRER